MTISPTRLQRRLCHAGAGPAATADLRSSTSPASTVSRRAVAAIDEDMSSPPSRRAKADVAAVYGASSQWSKDLFVADFAAVLYHGGFFADLATRLRYFGEGLSNATVLCLRARGRSFDISGRTGSWPLRNPALVRSGWRPSSAAACIKSRLGEVLPANDRQDGNPPIRRGVELQGRRSGRRGAARRVLSRNFLEVR